MTPLQLFIDQKGIIGILWLLLEDLRTANRVAIVIAILTPLLLIFVRRETRYNRLMVLRDLMQSYPAISKDSGTSTAEANPSFEFVKSKYTSGLTRPPAPGTAKDAPVKPIDEVQHAIKLSRSFGSMLEIRLLLASAGLILIAYAGFSNLQIVVANGFQVAATVTGNQPCPPAVSWEQIRIVGALAFAGAYIAALRIFIRGLAVFDLSAYTILRQCVEILASVILTIMLYKAFPDPQKALTAVIGASTATTCEPGVPWIWLALAPLLGLLPQSATKFLMIRLQSLLSWVKMDDDRFAAVTRIVPLDVIDGIDYETRFRLEECGIYDVQNLATYNPIMMHVETPYGIYQTIDWVAQAQLCHMIGLEKFLFLRNFNVRTIFDLERAIDYKSRTDRRKGDIAGAGTIDSPDEFDLIFAGILFAPTTTLKSIATTSGLQPFRIDDGSKVTVSTVDEYCHWAFQLIQKDPARVKVCVEHLMGWMADDLHIRRLRRIWQEISDNLGERTNRLDNPREVAPLQTDAAQGVTNAAPVAGPLG